MALELVADPQALRQLHGPLPYPRIQTQGAGDAVGMEDVVEQVQIVQQLEVLEDKTDVADAERASAGVAQGADVGVVHSDAAFRGRDDAGHQVEQRGLARAARPDHGELLTCMHLQGRDVQPKTAAGILEVQTLDVDHEGPLAPAACSADGPSVVETGD